MIGRARAINGCVVGVALGLGACIGWEPLKPTTPSAPLEIVATAGEGRARVQWKAPAENGRSELTGYTVTSSVAGTPPVEVAATVTDVYVPNLVLGTPYTFTVSATNAVGKGELSAPSNEVTPHSCAGTWVLVPQEAEYSVGIATTAATHADFNSDGKVDLAMASHGTSSVNVLLGKGDGTFQDSLNTNLVGRPGADLFAADLNGDGHPDLVVAQASFSLVSILMGNGDGTFETPVNHALTTDATPEVLAPADFDGDDVLDFVSSSVGTSSLTFFKGAGDGTFTPGPEVTQPHPPAGLAALDVDEDGTMDLAYTGVDGAFVVVRGKGDGTFEAPIDVVGGKGLLISRDLNGDGHADLISGSDTPAGVSVTLGHGAMNNFLLPGRYETGAPPGFMVAEDLNLDGKLDLATAEFDVPEISVLLGNGNGTFKPVVHYPGYLKAAAIVAADFNGDGATDLVITSGGAQSSGRPGSARTDLLRPLTRKGRASVTVRNRRRQRPRRRPPGGSVGRRGWCSADPAPRR
jgi:hypothetical protein